MRSEGSRFFYNQNQLTSQTLNLTPSRVYGRKGILRKDFPGIPLLRDNNVKTAIVEDARKAAQERVLYEYLDRLVD